MVNITLTVKGMHCQGCENRIKRTLIKNEAIKLVEATHQDDKVNITYDDTKLSVDSLVLAIEALAFKVVDFK
jgi:copper chaperone CopZ